MIENVTNLTNTTNVTSASDGFISTMLHSQDFWVALIVGVVLLGGTIMIRWLLQKKQQAHDVELLKLQLDQTKDIEEQRRKDEKEPPKELLKSRLNKFITYWEEDKESLLEGDKKRKKELKKKLFEIGNELKKKVDEKEDLLPQPVVRKVENIAKDIINFSNKITHGAVANENVERTKRINQKLIEEGDTLIEKAKEIIKILGEENE
jgi:hypothetical protein